MKARKVSPTLGKVPVMVRSLRQVGGERGGCKFPKKANSRARRAGWPDAETMLYALLKANQ